MIDVEERYAGRRARAASTTQLAPEDFEQAPTIPGARERVVRGALLELGLHFQEAILEVDDALPGDEPRFELVGVDGLLDVAVRAAVHGFDERLASLSG